jgi:S-formylglutathione hydrolase FrmB
VAILLVAACGGSAYSSTSTARVVPFALHSRLTHGVRHELLVVPKHHGDWMLVLLHGYQASPSMFLTKPFYKTLSALGNRAPEVLLLDGGADSYWHNRSYGKWGSMIWKEAIPTGLRRTHAKRVAIGGISMGGYGAILAGSRHHFCAVGAQSPALWTSPGATAPGAFDDAADYYRNDVFERRTPKPLWIDLGASDPFYNAALAYAHRAGVTAHVRPGGHDSALWDAFTPKFLRFFAHACA